METYRLRYFTTIAETGSLTRAAQLLGVSHSGLSKAVSNLENEIGLQLFRPVGRGLEITPDGKWFYQKAREILRISDEIMNGHQKPRTSVRIGLSEVVAITCAGALAYELKVPVTFTETDVGEVENKIIAGEIDFGISFVPLPRAEIEYLEIGKIRFNAYASEVLLRKHQTQDLPFAVPHMDFPSNPMGFKSRDGWPSTLPRLSQFKVASLAMALNLLVDCQAAAYLPDFVVNQKRWTYQCRSQIVKVKELADAESVRKIFLAKSHSLEESKEMMKAAKVIRRIIRQSDKPII